MQFWKQLVMNKLAFGFDFMIFTSIELQKIKAQNCDLALKSHEGIFLPILLI
jgi:hypothetical protein